MTTQLDIYNNALMLCEERFLASLTEEREPRRLLDLVWSSGGVQNCLEDGQWNFAMRSIQIDYDPGIEPSFGYRRAFDKPTDWLLTSAMAQDEYFRSPLLRYWDEAGFWYADLDTIYVRYISSDPAYGLDLNKWPNSFYDYVCESFANKVILKLTRSEAKLEASTKRLAEKLKIARSAAAMSQPTSFPARGSWGLSRQRYGGRGDRGNTSGNLIG